MTSQSSRCAGLPRSWVWVRILGPRFVAPAGGDSALVRRDADRRQLESVLELPRRVLRQCAATCEEAVGAYVARFGLRAEHQLFRELIPAIASLKTAADLLGDDRSRELVLRLAHQACGRAAIECRRHGLDEPLLRCAAACERALAEIELL